MNKQSKKTNQTNQATTKKTTAKKSAKKSSTKKATTKKSAAKKTTAKKTAAKKPVKQAAAKESSTKKTTTKKAATKKPTAKESSTKKSSTKKTTAKKATTKKTAAKKPAAKKATAKKATTKKPTAKKKPAAKKAAAKKRWKPIRRTQALVEKVTRIHEMLEELYPETPVPLDHKDPYTLLIAVLLSAQCTDERVNRITPHLFAKADNPTDMIALTVEEIADVVRPCGLVARKSKAIWDLSRIILDDFGGEVPTTLEELETLPGVGHKTASVVMTQAFGVPAFPVDTHIHRLAGRWGLTKGTTVEHTEADLKRLFPKESWGKVHLQFIFFGREYCPARGHDAASCPICSWAGE